LKLRQHWKYIFLSWHHKKFRTWMCWNLRLILGVAELKSRLSYYFFFQLKVYSKIQRSVLALWRVPIQNMSKMHIYDFRCGIFIDNTEIYSGINQNIDIYWQILASKKSSVRLKRIFSRKTTLFNRIGDCLLDSIKRKSQLCWVSVEFDAVNFDRLEK
jgi:hypothetical protein